MLLRLPSLLGAVVRLKRLLGQHRIEALQTHLPMANFFGLVMGRLGTCRVYPTVHNNREFDYGDRSGPLREKMRRSAYRLMLSWCRRMIAVSDQVKSSMAAELGLSASRRERIVVVPNGVPVPPSLTPESRISARTELGIGPDKVLIVGAGRLSAQKNFSDLIEALAAMKTSPSWTCRVAGTGPRENELLAAARGAELDARIRFVGHVADMTAFLGAADIFCLPSRYEGLPLILLEAMAAGLPVVAYAIDGVTDVVTHETEALLAEPNRPTDLAAHLSRLVADAAERTAIGRAGRTLVERKYDFARVADRLEEVCAT